MQAFLVLQDQISNTFASFAVVESDLGVRPIAEWLVLGTCAPTEGKGPSAGSFFSILVHESAAAFDEERAIFHDLDPGSGLSGIPSFFIR